MSAYKLHEPKNLANFRLGDYDEPTVRDYRDWALANGWLGYRGEVLPMITFSDAAGVGPAIGAGVTKFQPGDRVAINLFPNGHDGAFSAAKVARSLGGRVAPSNEAPNLHLQGIYVGSAQMLADLRRAFNANSLKPVVGEVFEFE